MKAHSDLFGYRFLLVSLHIDGILRETTISPRASRLWSMNSGVGLGGAYDATLARIKAQDREKARLALATLMWVCHSERALQVDELCHALAVEIGSADFDPGNVPLITTLLSYCQGLITVDKEASTVRLIHHTLREYLSAYPDLFVTAHSTIAETCLTYLNSQQVNELPLNLIAYDRRMPFLNYSSRHWGTHAKREFSDGVMSLALGLLSREETHISSISLLGQSVDGYVGDGNDFDDHSNSIDDSPLFSRLVDGYVGDGNDFDDHSNGIDDSPFFSGLHCASFFGIVELVTALMDNKVREINRRDWIGVTPLLWAAWNGHEEVVRFLLGQENISPDRSDRQGRTPLWRAASGGHEGAVRLLLKQRDVDPNSQDKTGETPLQSAVLNRHVGVVKLLIGSEDVNLNCPNKEGQTALWLAAVLGTEEVVKILLEREDIDLNCRDNGGRTPLQMASILGKEGVVKTLLGREDTNLNCRDSGGRTPLQTASILGKEGVVKTLLGREDTNLNCRDSRGRTPLQIASILGKVGVIKILLERRDIDLNLTSEIMRAKRRCCWLLGSETRGQ